MIGKDNSKVKTLNPEDKSFGGTIYWYTGDHFDTWGSTPVPLVLVDAGVKKTISGFPMGSYRLTGLPLNQEITITASKTGYKSDTLKHTFTDLHPNYYYCFDLKEKDESSQKERNTVFLKNLLTSTFFSSDTWSNLLSTFSFVS